MRKKAVMLGGSSQEFKDDHPKRLTAAPALRVPSTAGKAEPVTQLEQSTGNEGFHSDPSLLLTARILSTIRQSAKAEEKGVYVGKPRLNKRRRACVKRIAAMQFSAGFAQTRVSRTPTCYSCGRARSWPAPFDLRQMGQAGRNPTGYRAGQRIHIAIVLLRFAGGNSGISHR